MFKGELHMQIKRIFNEIFNFVTQKSTSSGQGRQDSNTTLPLNSTGLALETLEAEGLPTLEGMEEGVEEDLDLLYAYIEAELDNENAAGLYPHIHTAILTLESAASQYHDLKEILSAERAGTLLMPTRLPTFDFSYLECNRKAPPIYSELDGGWYWDNDFEKVMVKFSVGLLAKFKQTAKATSTMRSHMKSSMGEQMLFSYTIDQKEKKDLMISFVATTTANNPELCNVQVTVDRPSVDGAPLLADSRVYISQPHREIPGQQPANQDNPELESISVSPLNVDATETISQSTDPFGETIFRHIPVSDLPRLHFAIDPAPLL